MKISREVTASEFQVHYATQFNFCKYEGLFLATKIEIHRRCFQWNFAKFKNSYFREDFFFLRGAASSEKETGGEERAVTLAVSLFQGQLFIKS